MCLNVPLSFGFLVNVTVIESTSRVRNLDHTRGKMNKYQEDSQSQSSLQFRRSRILEIYQFFDNLQSNTISKTLKEKKIHEKEEQIFLSKKYRE